MKAADMRALSPEELGDRVTEWEEELFRARCNKTIGQLTDTASLTVLRRRIARAKTIQAEKLRDAAGQ